MSDMLVYRSESTGKSLWQEYRIYADHVEFDTHFGNLTVPFEHIERVEVSESEAKDLLRGDLHLVNFRPALKLDWANFLQHVVIDKDSGVIRRILFTPDDVTRFKVALEGALSRYRAKRGGDR